MIEVVEHFNNLPPLPLSNEACIDAQLMCQSYTDEPSVLKMYVDLVFINFYVKFYKNYHKFT